MSAVVFPIASRTVVVRLPSALSVATGSPCAKPKTLVAGKPGDKFTLDVTFVDGRRNLPVVTLRRAA